jgi:acetyl-CoA acyltransferase
MSEAVIIDEVVFGDANQAGEDNRNVARMAALLAGLPVEVPGTTINRLCASGMDAVGMAARGPARGRLRHGDRRRRRSDVARALRDAEGGGRLFPRQRGLRHHHRLALRQSGDEGRAWHRFSMPETADNVAADYGVSRADQDAFAARSQARWEAAQAAGRFGDEIVPGQRAAAQGRPGHRRHRRTPPPRHRRREARKLRGVNGPDLSVTAGNASGVNDGAAALLLANAARRGQAPHGLTPMARVVGMAGGRRAAPDHGHRPGPGGAQGAGAPGSELDQMDVIELNEAFAAQGLAVLRELGLPDDAPHVNPNGGAIALGHPLGMSGARLVLTAAYELKRRAGATRSARCAWASARASR